MSSLKEKRAKRTLLLAKRAERTARKWSKQRNTGNTLVEKRAKAKKKRIPLSERSTLLTRAHERNVDKARDR